MRFVFFTLKATKTKSVFISNPPQMLLRWLGVRIANIGMVLALLKMQVGAKRRTQELFTITFAVMGKGEIHNEFFNS